MASEQRPLAIAWWNAIAIYMKVLLVDTNLPGRELESLTGSEIEQIWKESGSPSASMQFHELKPEELMGRLVLVHHNRKMPYVRSIVGLTKTAFRISDSKILFRSKNGWEKTSDTWNRSHCELVTQEKAQEVARKNEEVKAIKRLKDEILCAVDNATLGQLEAAKKALIG